MCRFTDFIKKTINANRKLKQNNDHAYSFETPQKVKKECHKLSDDGSFKKKKNRTKGSTRTDFV